MVCGKCLVKAKKPLFVVDPVVQSTFVLLLLAPFTRTNRVTLIAFTHTATNPVYFVNILSELALWWLRGFTTCHEY